jgi:two-component system, cell cycle sensor histidine kinase and response regulator CckA
MGSSEGSSHGVTPAEAERRLRARARELHRPERLETLGQLAGGIAHDFNNILAAILSYAAFVAQATTDRPEVHADAMRIQAAVHRATRLTRQLLVFSRQDQISVEALDLSTVITEMRDLLRTTLGANIELCLAGIAGPAVVMADRGQIEQVLLNLVVNARDAMPRGGTLTIATRHSYRDEQSARAQPGSSPGPHVELVVNDTGVGMSPDVAAHIFEPFFTTKPRGEGTGLGLSTAYGIITRAGGTMSVESEEGTGTTFRIYLPALAEPAPAEPRRPTILVVDDEPDVLAATARILRRHGYATLEASNGDQALELALSHEVQLLLTDSVMPRMSGLTLARRIATLRPGLLIIQMSGNDSGDPAGNFIQKPFTAAQLIEKVQSALAAPSAPSR